MNFRQAYARFALWDDREILPWNVAWIFRTTSDTLVDHFPIAAIAAVRLVAPLDELHDDDDLRDALLVFVTLVRELRAIPMDRWKMEMDRLEPTAKALLNGELSA